MITFVGFDGRTLTIRYQFNQALANRLHVLRNILNMWIRMHRLPYQIVLEQEPIIIAEEDEMMLAAVEAAEQELANRLAEEHESDDDVIQVRDQ